MIGFGKGFGFPGLKIPDHRREDYGKHREKLEILDEFLPWAIKGIGRQDTDRDSVRKDGNTGHRWSDLFLLFRPCAHLLIEGLLGQILDDHGLAGIKDFTDDP